MKSLLWILSAFAFACSCLAHGDISSSSPAAPSRSQERCIPRSIQQVRRAVLDYSSYKTVSTRSGLLPFPTNSNEMYLYALQMIASEPPKTYQLGQAEQNTPVKVILQPFSLQPADKEFAPRFLIQCTLNDGENKSSFTHSCELEHRNDMPIDATALNSLSLKEKLGKNYGLKEFFVNITAIQGPATGKKSQCTENETLFIYNYSITSNPEHLRKIKDVVFKNLGPVSNAKFLKDKLEPLFGDDFLNSYYSAYYEAWANAIPQ